MGAACYLFIWNTQKAGVGALPVYPDVEFISSIRVHYNHPNLHKDDQSVLETRPKLPAIPTDILAMPMVQKGNMLVGNK